jgi:predicted kinase
MSNSGKGRPFTLVLPYYENPLQMQRQCAHLARLPDDVKAKIDLIVADDGSPEHPADVATAHWLGKGGFNGMGLRDVQMFRIEVDVRWNWLAARNIGVHHAKTEWVLLTDIDHEVPEATARRIIEKKLDPTNVYRFSRVDAPDLTPYKPHPNSWLMTKKMFDQVGGYDERFSGFYGTDGEFRDRVRAQAAKVIMLEEHLVRVPREVVADASTTRYGRKQPEDHDGVSRVRAQIAREGGRPKRLSFPYHQTL